MAGFQVLGATDWYVSWEGSLQPLAMRYTVRVSMCFDKPLSNAVIVGYAPRVKVVDPLLRRRSEEPREPIPRGGFSAATLLRAAAQTNYRASYPAAYGPLSFTTPTTAMLIRHEIVVAQHESSLPLRNDPSVFLSPSAMPWTHNWIPQ